MRTLVFCCLLALNVLYAAGASAAGRTVSGTVISAEDNEPLVGASVIVTSDQLKKAGSSQESLGVLTDIDGKFTIAVPAGVKELKCSYVGYTAKTVTLSADKDKYTIIMESSSTMLKDVVVTGYQVIERRKLTASISKVGVDDEMRGAVMNVDQILAGQVAGLSAVQNTGTPGAPMKIRIRGTASLSGTQDPLWVIDGVPMNGTDVPAMEELKDIDNIYQSSVAGLNPADIESITVLKDAAATAIYGTRAANGVIVITTKNGKAGKAEVNFSTRLSFSPKPSIDRLNLLTASEKVDLELDLLQSDYTYRENKGGVSRILQNAGMFDAYKAGGWNALSPDVQAQINSLRAINTDWNDILFRSTFNQEYNFSVSGGNDKATYYTSVGFYDENGNVPGVNINRFNAVLKTSYRLSSRLKVGASLFANRRKSNSYLTDSDGFTNPVYYSRRANPYQLPYDENGNYIYDIDIQGREDSDLKFNVFEERENTDYTQESMGVTALFDVNLRINDSFKASTQLGFQLDHSDVQAYAHAETYAMRKEFERTTLASLGGVSFLPDGGRHMQNRSTNKQINWKAQVEYGSTFSRVHDVEAILGTEIRKTWYDYFSSTAYGYDKKTLTSKPVLFPNESWARQYSLHSESYAENAYASFYGTASYSLMHRYTIGTSIRFDGSDLFGVDKKYRFLPLYSFSGLWRASEEPFLREVSVINNLGFRVSYGIQGNIDKSTSSYVMGYYNNISILPGMTEDVIVLGTPPNRRLRWEKTRTLNAGADMSVLDNAISFSLDYYHRKGSDLIALKMLPLETGFSSTSVNWASMRNQGVELALSTRNISTKDFTWTTNFNIAYNENTVLQETVPSNQTTPSREGHPVNSIFAYKTAGLDDEGYPLFLNKDGEAVTAAELLKLNGAGASMLSAEEQRNMYSYIGSGDPLITGGFINTFKYKQFDLSLNFAFNLLMYSRVTPSYSNTIFDRGMNTNRDILNRWTPSNSSSTLPALLVEGKRQSEYVQYSEFSLYSMMDTWVKRSDHVRLQNIRLGYNIPKQWLSRIGVKNAVVAFEARNLLVFGCNYDNYLDPETMGNQFAQPIPKSYTFSLNVGF